MSRFLKHHRKNSPNLKKNLLFVALALGLCLGAFFLLNFIAYAKLSQQGYRSPLLAKEKAAVNTGAVLLPPPAPLKLDQLAYDQKLIQLANYPTSTGTTSAKTASTTKRLWPAKAVYPNGGAILPFKRIVAYYGNFYSKQMGALGQYPLAEMLSRLDREVKRWEAADPSTPVVPAIHYIAVTAQASAGADGKYRLRMPKEQIDIAIKLADQIHGLVFLDIQVGLSTLQSEIPQLEPYLKRPEVHLGIDPEFSMKTGAKPGTVIGSFSATDINYAATYLAKIVRDNHLPPKILIIHRFTQPMVKQALQIKPLPEVQIVMHMDGWGSPAKKIDSYVHFVAHEPIQFTGFKLFYKNDTLPPSPRLMAPAELLKLKPQPIYIQYQ
ncbi:MAG: hypothetical protein AAB900_01860 [Patescibacteria group bacterium]